MKLEKLSLLDALESTAFQRESPMKQLYKWPAIKINGVPWVELSDQPVLFSRQSGYLDKL